jgi:hypothetical protein
MAGTAALLIQTDTLTLERGGVRTALAEAIDDVVGD